LAPRKGFAGHKQINSNLIWIPPEDISGAVAWQDDIPSASTAAIAEIHFIHWILVRIERLNEFGVNYRTRWPAFTKAPSRKHDRAGRVSRTNGPPHYLHESDCKTPTVRTF